MRFLSLLRCAIKKVTDLFLCKVTIGHSYAAPDMIMKTLSCCELDEWAVDSCVKEKEAFKRHYRGSMIIVGPFNGNV